MGDLEGFLKQSGVLEEESLDLDLLKADVMAELQARAMATADAYPYEIGSSVVRLKSDYPQFIEYTFCLLLSYFGWSRKQGSRLFPARLFEDLSCHAAKSFLNGEGVRFSPPRQDLPREFKRAIATLCLLAGEGGGLKEHGMRAHAQDDKLDVVAWRHFPDRLSGKLLLYGQCATGKNWTEKTNELQPLDFSETWFVSRPVSYIKAFFMPHRIEGIDWEYHSIRGGIIFDRCRIAFWAKHGPKIKNALDYIRWSRGLLEGVRP